MNKIRKLPTGTVAQLLRASVQQAEVMGWNRIEFLIFSLFRHVLSSLLHWRRLGRSNFVRGLHYLVMLIRRLHKNTIEVTIHIYI